MRPGGPPGASGAGPAPCAVRPVAVLGQARLDGQWPRRCSFVNPRRVPRFSSRPTWRMSHCRVLRQPQNARPNVVEPR
eukprot:5810705-Pyramimonas_sp.AAC.1